MKPSLYSIGKLWSEGEAALSQVYLAGKICEELISGNDFYETSNDKKNLPPIGKCAIVTLSDSHVLGKNIVISFFKASGFELIDYGFGISPEETYKKALEDKIEYLLV